MKYMTFLLKNLKSLCNNYQLVQFFGEGFIVGLSIRDHLINFNGSRDHFINFIDSRLFS